MRIWHAALAIAALSTISVAQAQDYPTRPVRIVVPAAPGGSFDALARILAQGLSERWPHRVIVDNRPGGGGNIGAGAVAKADPDGYTLLVWNDTLLINPALFKEAAVRSQAGFHADFAVDVFAERAGRASVGQPQEFRRVPQGRARQSRQAQLRLARQRQPGPPVVRNPQAARRDRRGARALSRRGSGDHRHGGRARFRWAWSQSRAPSVTSGRHADRAGGHIARAREGDADGADHRRGGRAGLPDQRLPRHPRAGRHAARDRRELEKDITEVLKSPAVNQKLIDLGFDPVAGSGCRLAAIIERDLPVWRDVVQKSGAKAE